MIQSESPAASPDRASLATVLRLVQVSLGLRLVLDVVGLKQFFEIYTDLETALKSFTS